ncbi:hypothetical protein ACFQ8E_09300 [Isoptericola sp. NPDC056573]|uniref:hypothetical protein n=1 Tax=Isoptericola sp. NPDC056573 TaxID=3345868 RepID=UPI00368510B7
MVHVPAYVADRIRQPVPDGCSVVPGSTPIVVFGDVRTATVATLGFNPSKKEFVTNHGAPVDPRRLATYESLGVETLMTATDEQVAQVLTECYEYFQHYPYWTYFKPSENLLQTTVGASYLDGTACHLDLIQWATDPVFGKLPGTVRKKLVAADQEFLRQQLLSENVRLVLLNGAGVIDAVRKMGVDLVEGEPAVADDRVAKVVVGEEYGARFIGWNRFLPSARGVTNALKQAIYARVKDEAAKAEFTLHPAPVTPSDGLIERGAIVTTRGELHALLKDWTETSSAATIGDVGTFGGKAWLSWQHGAQTIVLNADTSRAAVLDYLAFAAEHGVDEPWRVVANAKGKVNRVVYRDDLKLTGWYCYTAKPWMTPGDL